jgi:hypothetical protein
MMAIFAWFVAFPPAVSEDRSSIDPLLNVAKHPGGGLSASILGTKLGIRAA